LWLPSSEHWSKTWWGKTLAAARAYDVATLFITGGVAANQELRRQFESDAAREGLFVYFPSRPLSTDNAAMIAAAAYPKFSGWRFRADGFLGGSRNGVEVKQQ
jgi:N6-L-threonylcarbamoyladenine synthase